MVTQFRQLTKAAGLSLVLLLCPVAANALIIPINIRHNNPRPCRIDGGRRLRVRLSRPGFRAAASPDRIKRTDLTDDEADGGYTAVFANIVVAWAD